MTRNRRGLIAALALTLGAAGAEARLTVVATTPDLGSVAHAVGRDRITVSVLAKPTEDPHFVDARPTHIVTLNRADVLLEGGADLEMGWLPPVALGARNAKVLPGAPGRIVASEGIQLLDIPAVADRSRGDVHATGNPHFLMDPLNAKVLADHIAEAFCRIDGEGCAAYRANLASFKERIDAKMKQWTELLKPYPGSQIVAFHVSWRYFAQRFGLKSEIFLEPKPGIPPSPPHLAAVIGQMRAQGVRVILIEPYQSRKVAETVASHTGATLVDVAQFPGALPGTDNDYVALMDADVRAIAGALGAKP